MTDEQLKKILMQFIMDITRAMDVDKDTTLAELIAYVNNWVAYRSDVKR